MGAFLMRGSKNISVDMRRIFLDGGCLHDGEGKISAGVPGGGGYGNRAAGPDRFLAVRRLRACGQRGDGFPAPALGGGVHRGRLDFRDCAGLGADEIRVPGYGLGGGPS